MNKSVYIHIPFCRQKCRYCSFVSFSSIERKNDYLIALENEIKNRYKNEELNTLYFGGGTPSLLSPDEFYRLIKLFKTKSETEITAESNPENLSFEYLKSLKDIGINRLSLGCQTFEHKILKEIGRKHSPDDVVKAVKTAQKAGFKNISLDFIYGLPNQTIDSFVNDLHFAKNLGIQHISLYGLKIENGCYFYKHPPKNISDDDLQAEMFLKAIETLSAFEHYEISNFALAGFHSRHNLNYWNNENYYGFGISAHGYEKNTRYSNTAELEKYIKNPFQHETETVLTKNEKLEEEIFLGFRKMNGICVEKINKKFEIDFDKKYTEILNKYLLSKHLLKTQEGYKLSNDGILVSNYILSDFIS